MAGSRPGEAGSGACITTPAQSQYCSVLERAGRQPLDELLLEDEVEHQHRHREQHQRGRQQRIVAVELAREQRVDARGSVRIALSVMKVSAKRNSFQFCRNRKIEIVASAGRVSGSMICQKIRNSLAPSMPGRLLELARQLLEERPS